MKNRNRLATIGAFAAIPAAFSLMAFVDAIFELGVLHSTWQTGLALFIAVSLGLCLLWHLDLRAQWQNVVLMVAYAPAMFAALVWLSLVIRFNFDDCTGRFDAGIDSWDIHLRQEMRRLGEGVET